MVILTIIRYMPFSRSQLIELVLAQKAMIMGQEVRMGEMSLLAGEVPVLEDRLTRLQGERRGLEAVLAEATGEISRAESRGLLLEEARVRAESGRVEAVTRYESQVDTMKLLCEMRERLVGELEESSHTVATLEAERQGLINECKAKPNPVDVNP